MEIIEEVVSKALTNVGFPSSFLVNPQQDVVPTNRDTVSTVQNGNSTPQDVGQKARDSEGTVTKKKKKNKRKKPCGAERQRRLLAKRKGDSGSLIPAANSSALSGSAPSDKGLLGKGLIGLSGTGGSGDGVKLTPAKRNRDSNSSTPREIKKRKTEAGRPTYSESVATPLKIAVILQSYPEDRLSEDQASCCLHPWKTPWTRHQRTATSRPSWTTGSGGEHVCSTAERRKT